MNAGPARPADRSTAHAAATRSSNPTGGSTGGPAGARSDRADKTRQTILYAAVHHFSQHGLAGARIDAIAKTAGVNKALLYYYFQNKSSLYRAALEDAAGKVVESAIASLASGASAGERLLRLVLNHFDRISAQRELQSLMQQEMVRFHRGESDVMPLVARSLYGPLLKRMQAVVREGIRSRELCETDWMQILYAALGANIFYFLSAPLMRLAVGFEPLDAAALEARRKSAMEFLGQALFCDRDHGSKLARRVLAETPMPKPTATAKKLAAARKYL